MEGKSSISRVRAVFAVAALAMGVLLFVGCAATIPQADYDAVKAQLATQEQKAAALQQQLSSNLAEATALQQQIAAKEGDVKAAQEKLAAKEKEIADLKKAAGALQGVTPLVWTKVMPTPTPRPAPTPPPAGYVPPTPIPPDPVTVNTVFPYTFYIETLTGHQVSEDAQFPSCVLNAQFRRGTHLVWRFEVFDTSTGKRVTSLDNPSIKLVLENGKELTPRFSRKGGTGPWTWATGWDVPMDYPLGELNYTIVVTSKDGRTGTFDPNLVALVNKDRGIDQRLQIVP